MKALLPLFSILALSISAQASTTMRWQEAAFRDEFSLSGILEQFLAPELLPETPLVTEGTITQKLNPADPADPSVFKQRYFVSSTYASSPDAPVVYYICGEAECSATYVKRLVGDVAKSLGAYMVALEHRYYGKSQPFADFSVDHLKYLRTDFALADLATFQKVAADLFNMRGKWLIMGGSYAGALSAYYRMQHPELVVGALASSAPVEARNNYEEFDYHATVVAGQACADAVRSVITHAEAITSDPVALQALKAQFDSADMTDPEDFLYLLSDIAAESMQYGKRVDLCTRLLSSGDTTANYAAYVHDFLGAFGATAISFVAQGGLDLEATSANNARPWFYQSCTEYGYWQNAYHDARFSMRSPRINAAYHARLCQRLFGIEEADDSVMNRTHYLPLLDPKRTSRILFTNGSEDPWSELSISSKRGNDTNSETTAHWIDGSSHCSDLRASAPGDSDALNTARAHFSALLAEWLK